VVLPDSEYPANVVPWARLADRGVRLKIVKSIGGELPLESYRDAVDDSTRVVTVSHVEFGNGFLNDIAALSELAHRHGALLFVDAAQSLGLIHTRVAKLGIDGLSSCGYKWLCGPGGTGMMYARRDLIPDISPAYAGFESMPPDRFRKWFGAISRDGWRAELQYPLSSLANRFEFGEHCTILLMGFTRSLEYLLDHGTRRIEKRARGLADYLISRLEECGMDLVTPADPEKRAGIITFHTREYAGGNRALTAELATRGILVSPRIGGIRASCHFFNDAGDVDSLVDQIAQLTG
jgi:selenocysteine lyase/cysteine desulfurase